MTTEATYIAPEVPKACRPEKPKLSGNGLLARIDRWIDDRLNYLVAGILAAGFVLRFRAANWGFLNPDEALHYIIFNQRSVYWAYKVSLTNAHPPLIYLVLYFWRFLGTSELMLRLPSAIAGTLACWFAYKWTAGLFDKIAGSMVLMFFAFSPVLIALSAEVRSYALLLLFESSALYFAEAAVREASVRKMWYFSGSLYFAILSHYSALFFALALGIYMLVRAVSEPWMRRILLAWGSGQAGALMLCLILYVTHISKLKSYIALWEVSFDKANSRTGHDHLLAYARERTFDVFQFLFRNPLLATSMLVLWAAAIAFLVSCHWIERTSLNLPFLTGTLLLLPILGVFSAGVAGIYPYVGSRHTVFLAPFIFAALAFLLTRVAKRKLWAALVMSAFLAGISHASGQMSEPYITRKNQNRALMTAALNDIRQSVPQGSLILTDYQSALIFVYYLCGPEYILPVGTFNLPASRVKCGGYTVASFQTWSLDPTFFLEEFGKIVQAQRREAGEKVWVFVSGWEPTFARDLPLASSRFRCVTTKTFGDNIAIIPLAIGTDLSPIDASSNCL